MEFTPYRTTNRWWERTSEQRETSSIHQIITSIWNKEILSFRNWYIVNGEVTLIGNMERLDWVKVVFSGNMLVVYPHNYYGHWPYAKKWVIAGRSSCASATVVVRCPISQLPRCWASLPPAYGMIHQFTDLCAVYPEIIKDVTGKGTRRN